MKPRLLLCLLVAAAACDLPTPAEPRYARDVRPIFLSHCIRCHGAGGTLQGDPRTYPLGDDQKPAGYDPGNPFTCYLDSYEDRDSCVFPANGTVPPPSATCKVGAHSCTTLPTGPGDPSWMVRKMIGDDPKNPVASMPPPPAPALTDWELDIVRRWIVNPQP